jgi:chromosome segregation ATPase
MSLKDMYELLLSIADNRPALVLVIVLIVLYFKHRTNSNAVLIKNTKKGLDDISVSMNKIKYETEQRCAELEDQITRTSEHIMYRLEEHKLEVKQIKNAIQLINNSISQLTHKLELVSTYLMNTSERLKEIKDEILSKMRQIEELYTSNKVSQATADSNFAYIKEKLNDLVKSIEDFVGLVKDER